MAVYRFETADGKMLKLDTSTATLTLLLSTKWARGQDQTRWNEIYKTQRGRFVCLSRTLWQGEHNEVHEMEEAEVLHRLALSEDRQRTHEGDALLEAGGPCEEA